MMSEKKWTPGPWEWRRYGNDKVTPTLISTTEFAYGSVPEPIDFYSPMNAALIAAAPDLYDALENVAAKMREMYLDDERAYADAIAALSRARGQQ